MRLLKEMKEGQNFSTTEQNIIDFMLQNPKQLVDLSIRQLAEKTYASSAAIFRLCQKLGLKGYTEFKIKFISEISRADSFEKMIGEKPITAKDNALSVLNKVARLQIEAIEETKNELDIAQVMKLAAWIDEAKVLDFYAFDNNVRLAQLASCCFMQLGKPSIASSAANFQFAQAISSTPDHLAILLSRTGENRKLIRIAKTLRGRKVRSIALTPSQDCPIAKLCDESLYVANTIEYMDLGYFIYSTGVTYLLDMLLGLIMARHYNRAMNLDENLNDLMGRHTDHWRAW